MMANGKSCYIGYAGSPKGQAGPDGFEKFKKQISQTGHQKGYSIDSGMILFEFSSSAETGLASP